MTLKEELQNELSEAENRRAQSDKEKFEKCLPKLIEDLRMRAAQGKTSYFFFPEQIFPEFKKQKVLYDKLYDFCKKEGLEMSSDRTFHEDRIFYHISFE